METVRLKVAFIVVTAAALLWTVVLVSALCPDEKVPRCEVIPGGSTVYVIASLRNAVVIPTTFALVAVCIAGYVVILIRRGLATGTIDPAGFKHIPSGCFAAVITAVFGILLVFAVIVNPCRRYHRITVGPDEIVFASLYRSWSVPISEVRSGRTIRDEFKGKKQLHFVVTTNGGRKFLSVETGHLTRGEKQLGEYNRLFANLTADVKQRIAKKGNR